MDKVVKDNVSSRATDRKMSFRHQSGSGSAGAGGAGEAGDAGDAGGRGGSSAWYSSGDVVSGSAASARSCAGGASCGQRQASAATRPARASCSALCTMLSLRSRSYSSFTYVDFSHFRMD